MSFIRENWTRFHPGLETIACAVHVSQNPKEKRKKEGRPTKTDPRTLGFLVLGSGSTSPSLRLLGEVVARLNWFKRSEQDIESS